MNFKNIGLNVPTILLPNPKLDFKKWAVIACDQYTSQPEYWEKVKSIANGQPSTLNLMLPEVFLDSENKEEIVKSVNENMRKYFDEEILVSQKPGFILVERMISPTKKRKGLIVALDLEHYDYSKGAKPLIRSTEGTKEERLLPRMKIRENSIIEMPHIMVLIDDPEKTVIEPLFEKNLKPLYDFELMMNSGHLKGYKIDQEEIILEIVDHLTNLADPEVFKKKYDVVNEEMFLYAMGDGNHSFATAKAIWEKMKASADDQKAIMQHPARYGLVELINIHDQGIEFKPIHRVVFNVNPQEMLNSMKVYFQKYSSTVTHQFFDTEDAAKMALETSSRDNSHVLMLVAEGKFGILTILNPQFNLEVGSLQDFLDNYAKEVSHVTVDYIHGEDVVHDLGSKLNNIGFYLPVLRKQDLFKTVIVDGALPMKSFSLGEAEEKKFYMECRVIQTI